MCVHFGNNIVGESFAAHNTLVMNGNLRADFVKISVTGVLVAVTARFVAERPHCYTGAVSVAVIHSFYTVNVTGLPGGIVADKVNILIKTAAAAVSFNIRLVNNI